MTKETNYIYDLANRLEEFISNNLQIKYKYDINSNVNKKNYFVINETNVKPLYTVNYEYNKDDNITKVEIDGNTINYNYDYLGRLTNKNINDNLQINYTYITNGDKTSLIVNTYTIGSDTYKYEYDEVYNITKIYLNNELINEYEYDDINELIFEKNYILNRKYNYVYDSEGNILVKKEYNLETNEVVSSYNYEYNNPEWEDQLTKFNNESITYDAIGNPLTIGDAILTWKIGRRLTTYTKGDLNVNYEYNVDGIRTSKIVNNQTTNYILEGDNIVIEESPKGMIYYLYDSNELIGLKYNDQTYFYKKNLQGDVIGLYNSDYEQIVTYTYDSWGKVISIKDSNGNIITDSNHIGIMNPFRYRSYYYDKETKLYYLNSRYYNPEWSRFVNADIFIATGQGVIQCNMYSYCENNPVNCTDDNAYFWKKAWNGLKKFGKKVIDTGKELFNETKKFFKSVRLVGEFGHGFGVSFNGAGIYSDVTTKNSGGVVTKSNQNVFGTGSFSITNEHTEHIPNIEDHQNFNENLLFNDYPSDYYNHVNVSVDASILENASYGYKQKFEETTFIGIGFDFHLIYGFHFKIGFEKVNEPMQLH